MLLHQRLAVFDALMLKAYASNDVRSFSDELEAFQVSFRRRRFGMLLTSGILDEYQKAADNPPQFQLQPVINKLNDTGAIVHLDEYRLSRFLVQLTGLPKWHQVLIRDAIAGGASYLITKWQRWLDLTDQTESRYGLRIVTPTRFVELEE